MSVTRRSFLGAAAALAARPAWALGESSEVDIAEIVLPSGTVSRPEAWKRLLYEVIQTTSVEAVPRAVQLAPDDPNLFRHPFAVLAGDAAFAPPGDAAVEQLVRYLSYGGFLLIDDTSGVPGSGFDRSVRALCERLFPTRPLTSLPSDHSLFRSFFLIRAPVGRVANHRTMLGVALGSTNPLVYFRDDLSGALDRRADARDALACTPGGEVQRREAVKLGVNLLMYALTSNYKHDQAHVKELMREGRIE